MKGTGPARFTVAAETAGRNTQFDDQDAILFLVNPARGVSADFEFADSTIVVHYEGTSPALYVGGFPEGYMPDTRNPVWLPVTTAQPGGVSGQPGGQLGSSDKVITDINPLNRIAATVTGSELTTAISWVEGSPPQGGGASGASGNSQPQFTDYHYRQCIIQAIRTIRSARVREAMGQPPRPDVWQYEAELSADDRWNKPVFDVTLSALDWSFGVPGPEYPAVTITGQHGAMFAPKIVDDDGDISTGYTEQIVPVRPLAGGVYTFRENVVTNVIVPCNWPPDGFNTVFTVTVAAPSGTIHEAFFDSATTTAGVGYFTGATTTGVLKPTMFSIRGRDFTIRGLKWEGGSVVLWLSPLVTLDDNQLSFIALGDNQLSFIALDGSTALVLRASDATGNSAAGTLTWAVADRPWSAGDLLMLRIGP